jgi:hypothetical protein
MSDWLPEIAAATHDHREARAKAYDSKAFNLLSRTRLEGGTEDDAGQASKWHVSRAKGQRERIERVEACSNDALIIRCQACGLEHERPARCGCRLLCVRCRGVRARQTRMRFNVARSSLLAEARGRGLLNPHRRGGAWGERFLTLTAPHVVGDAIEERIIRVLDAWKSFVRYLQAWQRECRLPSIEWFRVFEWTPTDDGLGHPHLHVWLFSPFLDRELLLEWWTKALQRELLALESAPIIDIRAVKSGVEHELVKYLTKDIDEQGNKIAPQLYAQVYCALDQRRALQASRGFMARAKRERLPCTCGATLPRYVKRKKAAVPAEP